MRVRSSMNLLFVMGVLIGSLVLAGCPKRPEVIQAGPAAVGPPAAVAPAPKLQENERFLTPLGSMAPPAKCTCKGARPVVGEADSPAGIVTAVWSHTLKTLPRSTAS